MAEGTEEGDKLDMLTGLNSLIETSPNLANLTIMERFVRIGEAAKALGVSVSTLRRWEAVLNARLYGSRSHKNAKLIEGVGQAVEAAC